jgi:hypothetical protein
MIKRKRMIYDGKNRNDSEFAREMARSLGASAMENQWSIENMAE